MILKNLSSFNNNRSKICFAISLFCGASTLIITNPRDAWNKVSNFTKTDIASLIGVEQVEFVKGADGRPVKNCGEYIKSYGPKIQEIEKEYGLDAYRIKKPGSEKEVSVLEATLWSSVCHPKNAATNGFGFIGPLSSKYIVASMHQNMSKNIPNGLYELIGETPSMGIMNADPYKVAIPGIIENVRGEELRESLMEASSKTEGDHVTPRDFGRIVGLDPLKNIEFAAALYTTNLNHIQMLSDFIEHYSGEPLTEKEQAYWLRFSYVTGPDNMSVMAVQRTLANLGYLENGSVDSFWGKETETAFAEAKKDINLPDTVPSYTLAPENQREILRNYHLQSRSNK